MVYKVTGAMSGTSLDGLDLAYCQFEIIDGKWHFEILKAETIPYTQRWQHKLSTARRLGEVDLKSLHVEYGALIGAEIARFHHRNGIQDVDFIASHGHTVHHQPEKGISVQIGSGEEISRLTKCDVVHDFRVQDVALGGQGAPLVPIGDQLLFSDYDGCINLGGFANISFDTEGKRVAYDICPINIVLNPWAEKLGAAYDESGNWAREGSVDAAVLEKLNALAFYKKAYPKSLGIEWVISDVNPIMNHLTPKDALRTGVEHMAIQISNSINSNNLNSILLTGGGAFNSFLVENIQNLTSAKIQIPVQKTVDFKEALIFAFLGVLSHRNEVNILSSVTGASHDHCSGKWVRINK